MKQTFQFIKQESWLSYSPYTMYSLDKINMFNQSIYQISNLEIENLPADRSQSVAFNVLRKVQNEPLLSIKDLCSNMTFPLLHPLAAVLEVSQWGH